MASPTFGLGRFLLRLSPACRFRHSHSSILGTVLLRPPFHCHFCSHSSSSSTHQPLASGGVEEAATNWAQVDENALHDLMGAHVEWKREMDEEMLKRSQRAKLSAIRNLHDYLSNGPKEAASTSSAWHSPSEETQAEYDQALAYFEKRMAEEMHKTETLLTNLSVSNDGKKDAQRKNDNVRELDAFKKVYLRVLFRLFRGLYRQSADKVTKSGKKGLRRQRAEKAQVDQLNAAFDIVPEMTELKRRCFLGALWLADGQSFRFFDYLNTTFGGCALDGPHITYICHIAIDTKEPAVLEPLTEMSAFLPSNFLHLAKVFNSLALIYGQHKNFDALEKLWRKLDNMKRKVPYGEQSSRMKLILARIDHFYRTANRKAPGSLQAALKRLGGQPYFVSARAKNRERMMMDDDGGQQQQHNNNTWTGRGAVTK